MIKYSIIIPIYNEEESLGLLYSSLRKTMDGLGGDYEIIFVNDGSMDKSLEILKNISLQSNKVIIIDLAKNYGQSTAMQAGFDFTSGEIIITLDGDLQNDPEDIPRLLEKMGEGYDVVCGWRYYRYESLSRKVAAKIANILRRFFWGEKIHDVGCTLRVYLKQTLKDIYLYGHRHRFLTLFLLRMGFKIGELKITHNPRKFGRSKYSIFGRGVKSIVDLLYFIFSSNCVNTIKQKFYKVRGIIREGSYIYPE
ncbi:MAG: glycosyltransferase family 2 protein [Candidatus Omnitrophica bacterium]|nr:glycosyltransferase family 2 protein [Candidatus Omnitrophota bacterium]